MKKNHCCVGDGRVCSVDPLMLVLAEALRQERQIHIQINTCPSENTVLPAPEAKGPM